MASTLVAMASKVHQDFDKALEPTSRGDPNGRFELLLSTTSQALGDVFAVGLCMTHTVHHTTICMSHTSMRMPVEGWTCCRPAMVPTGDTIAGRFRMIPATASYGRVSETVPTKELEEFLSVVRGYEAIQERHILISLPANLIGG